MILNFRDFLRTDWCKGTSGFEVCCRLPSG